MDTRIRFTLNGKPQTIHTDGDRPLQEVLREDLHLTGTKYGCGEGQCLACTVLVDGEATASCLTPVSSVAAKQVVTIEGLAKGDRLHPVQQAFLDEGAFQCGYCTAGMILGTAAVLQKNPHATEADVMRELQGHICRCGSYAKYAGAIHRLITVPQTEKAQR
jgi:aerobic-type carbon monoxide dehydrogenase small subunit (CoxS/CutS family)